MSKNNRSSAFWSDAILAEVEGRTHLVKVYTQAAGGENTFIRDLEILKREEGYVYSATPGSTLSDVFSEPMVLVCMAYQMMEPHLASCSQHVSFYPRDSV